MGFYQRVAQFREPYQVLLDGEFVQAALFAKINLREQLQTLLLGTVKLMTSPCIMAWLKQQGDEFFGAYVASKRFEPRRCGHEGAALEPDACIRSIIGDNNRVKCVVATQDAKLRKKLLPISHVPMIYIQNGNLLLNDVSRESKSVSASLEQEQARVSEREKKILQNIAPLPTPAPKERTLKKKEPNPLSVRKPVRSSSHPSSATSKKRKRHPKK